MLLYLGAAALALFLFFFEKGLPLNFSVSDIPGLLLIALHTSVGLYFGARLIVAPDVRSADRMAERLAYRLGHQERQPESEDFMLLPDLLFVISLVIFVFGYIFALAANMDYVQRFIETEGRLLLALDTRTERMFVIFRYGIYLLIYPIAAGIPVLLNDGLRLKTLNRVIKPISLLLASVLLFSFSFPSNISPNGFGFLAWFSMAPLFTLLKQSQGFRRWMFYGISWTLLTVMIRNYWLGTFSLVSLQVAVVILGMYGVLFFLLLWFVERFLRRIQASLEQRPFLHFLVYTLLFSSMWTLYDWIFTVGFSAYPWNLMPHSQWRNTPLIQISSLTGMWSISQLLYLSNILITTVLITKGSGRRLAKRMLIGFAVLVFAVHAGGAGVLLQNSESPLQLGSIIELHEEGERAGNLELLHPGSQNPEEGWQRIALVQQNSDPRKHDYEEVLQTLTSLSRGILQSSDETDLLVWSETAFVPNIARWSNPELNPRLRLVRVVNEMLEFQRSTGTWLLTGNDDYKVILDDRGVEQSRDNYNAAILFDPEASRRDYYHKIRLVPFTEHFPYRDLFPGVYQLLLDFDVNFWEPGERRTVFRHPRFMFSTPICFEDAFPDEVRRFVTGGADIIINISNDYWSLTEVAAKQHFAAGLYRSVENRRVLLRSTASGMTTAVDPWGRILFELPSYRAMAASVDVQLPEEPGLTPYSRHGDWYIAALAALVTLLLGILLVIGSRSKSEEE